MNRHSSSAALLFLAVVVAFAACPPGPGSGAGDDDDSAAGSPSPSATPTPTITETGSPTPTPTAPDLQTLFAVNNPHASTSGALPMLMELDPSSGATLASVTLTDAAGVVTLTSCNGLATHPQTGALWVVLRDDAEGRHLGSIDPATGAVSLVGPLSDKVSTIAFDANGTLWGITGDGAVGFSQLQTISLADATMTFRASLGVLPATSPDGEALAFNRGDGRLYRMSGYVAWYYGTIDPATLTETQIYDSTAGGVTDRTNEALAAVSDGAGGFYFTNLASEFKHITAAGVTTAIGSTGSEYIKGLAWGP
jgi:hypothetical protein